MQVTSATSGTSTTTTSASSSTSSTASSTTVDYNSFLKLLVEELKDQDPTAPSDPTTFMSQLASFSSVEQQVQTNTKLDTLLTTNSLTQAESLIGKTVSDGSTSGTVSSVAVGSDGTTTATLSSGSTLTLGSGVSVSSSS